MSKSTIIRAIHQNPNLKREKMTSAPKFKAKHNVQKLEFAKKKQKNMSTDWNVVHVCFFSLITCIISTEPNIFLFLLYKSYLATKNNNKKKKNSGCT